MVSSIASRSEILVLKYRLAVETQDTLGCRNLPGREDIHVAGSQLLPCQVRKEVPLRQSLEEKVRIWCRQVPTVLCPKLNCQRYDYCSCIFEVKRNSKIPFLR